VTWRLAVTHRTEYEYAEDVVASFNELRMTPASSPHQLLVHHRTSLTPPVEVLSYVDYWGTSVEAFDLQTPHRRLVVVSDNIVETDTRAAPPRPAAWHDIDHPRAKDRFSEYLRHTALSPLLPDTDTIVEDVRAQADPLAAAATCMARVRERMEYVSGSTSVSTPATESWCAGRGVCQDYSHVMLSLLRSAGVPARYVSGYLYTGSGAIGEVAVGESHAWLEAWAGEWTPYDPTSGATVAQRHVVVAYGRDYGDVSPMRGIFSGGDSRSVDVEVTLTRQPR
jgi:transglutaminase-like putative cysteine protease